MYTLVDVEYVGSGKEEERRVALLKEVFEAFPHIPINIDIKINNDELITKVSDLIKAYNREDYTVWGNFSGKITRKCYKTVCIEYFLKHNSELQNILVTNE